MYKFRPRPDFTFRYFLGTKENNSCMVTDIITTQKIMEINGIPFMICIFSHCTLVPGQMYEHQLRFKLAAEYNIVL